MGYLGESSIYKGNRGKGDLLNGVKDEIFSSKFWGRNTVVYWSPRGLVFRLHDTDIVTVPPENDRIILNTGGWFTVTTKDRINRILRDLGAGSINVQSERGIWYVSKGFKIRIPGRENEWPENYTWGSKTLSAFYDGIAITRKGRVIGKVLKENKKADRLKKLISGYCRKIADLETLPEPGPGDCFYCQMREVKSGKPLGEVSGNRDHLLSHIKEGYVHGSLIINAIIARGHRSPAVIWQMGQEKRSRDLITRPVRWYLKKQLGLA